MRKSEAARLIREAGGKWEDFMEWMAGQTVSVYPDGETHYYDSDVERFIHGKCRKDTYVDD